MAASPARSQHVDSHQAQWPYHRGIAAVEPTRQPSLKRVDAETAVRTGPRPKPDLDDTSLYFNRELSWLEFNDRVLQLAEDESVPLLERIKFCAIWESNMDEFFMVRVANLEDAREAGREPRGPDGMSIASQIEQVNERVLDQRKRVSAAFKSMRPELEECGVRILPVAEASDSEREELGRALRTSGLSGADARW